MAGTGLGHCDCRMQHEARAHDLLHLNQYGGIQGRSAVDAALLFTEAAHNTKLAGIYTSMLVVDILQFFPSIQPEIAVEIFHRQGFAPELCCFLGSYLEDCTTCYIIANATSDLLNMPRGIPQGCKVCPIAACLYIAPVLHKLVPWNPERNHSYSPSLMTQH